MRAQKTDESRESLTLRGSSLPSGHDDARQALGELGRILNAERHGIRRDLARESQEITGHGQGVRQAERLKSERRDGLMADALATVILFGILRRARVALLHLGRGLMRAALAKQLAAVSRQNEQGYHHEKELGAKAAHGADW